MKKTIATATVFKSIAFVVAFSGAAEASACLYNCNMWEDKKVPGYGEWTANLWDRFWGRYTSDTGLGYCTNQSRHSACAEADIGSGGRNWSLNNRLSSVEICSQLSDPQQFRIRLYEHSNYEGETMDKTVTVPNNACLVVNVENSNDTMTSFRIDSF